MDLFKLQAEIGVEIQKAVDNLTQLSLKAAEVAEQIQDGLGGDNEVKTDTKKSVNSLTKLTSVINRQESELELLKRKYQDVYIQKGKNSKEAKKLAKEIDKLSKELNENKYELEKSKNAADKLDNSFEDLSDTAKNTASGGFSVLKGAMANLVSQGINMVIDGVKTLVKNAASYQSQMEQYTVSFEVMTGSAEKAAEVTEKIGEIAAKTPFEMTDLADATQLLINYGFEADDALEKMQMLGDIAQGNAEKMNRVATAYGQMSSAGKITLEDVKQMIEFCHFAW